MKKAIFRQAFRCPRFTQIQLLGCSKCLYNRYIWWHDLCPRNFIFWLDIFWIKSREKVYGAKVLGEKFEIVYEKFCNNLCPQNVILFKKISWKLFDYFYKEIFLFKSKTILSRRICIFFLLTQTNWVHFLIKIFNSIRFCRALNIVLILNLEFVLFYHHNWEQMRDRRISQIP